jgi:hypothetical protein
MVERLMPARAALPRRAALALLVAAVVLLHGWVAGSLADRMADLATVAAMPPRIEVAYVRELELAPPPAVAPVAIAPAPPPRRARRAAAPASAPQVKPAPEPIVVPDPPAEPVPAPPEPEAVAALAEPEPAAAAASAVDAPGPAEAAVAAAVADAAASAAQPFEWPASTRLSYRLSGNVRGEVHGDAQVEWIRSGPRYQVHLDVTVGLAIAPMLTRRMSSDGELTPEGLRPERYDEDTKVAFRERRRVTVLFEPHAVVLADGRRRERWPGLQDTASQFVQLSWLFTLRPERLRSGEIVEVPLALPRTVDRWVYDVLDEEPVHTDFGAVPAFHLKPRRMTRPGPDLSAEIWFAPQLRYLPVRIRIQQDAQTFIDLVLARRPELAGP